MKNLSVFIFIFSSLLCGFSQNIGFRAGLTGGAPIPTEIDSAATGTVIPSFTVGVAAEVWRKGHFAVSTDVLYERQFSSYSSLIPKNDTTLIQNVLGIPTQVTTYFKGDVKGRMNLHYLTIPVQVSYFPVKNLKIMAGGYIAPLIAGQDTGLAHLVIGNNFTTSDNQYNNFPFIKKMDMGICGGIGYDFPFGLFLDVRVNRVLKTLFPDSFFYENNQKVSRMYNTRASIGLGYYFFKKKCA